MAVRARALAIVLGTAAAFDLSTPAAAVAAPTDSALGPLQTTPELIGGYVGAAVALAIAVGLRRLVRRDSQAHADLDSGRRGRVAVRLITGSAQRMVRAAVVVPFTTVLVFWLPFLILPTAVTTVF